MSDLIALAERCVAATEPNFRLEQDIWAAAVAAPPANLSALGQIKPPAYTASLDAAMALIPEGSAWGAGFGLDHEYENECGWAWCGSREAPNEGAYYWSATPALALCAAALRARAAQ